MTHIKRNRRSSPAFLPVLVLSILFPCCCSGAGPASVSVIFSSEKIGPYKLARQALEKFFAQRQPALTINDYDLERIKPGTLVREIQLKRPAVIVAIGTPAQNFARENIPDIPVVFCMVLIPTALTPNMTGVSMDVPAAVKLKKMREILPNAKKVGVIYSPASAAWYDAVVRACDELGLKAAGRRIESGSEFPDVLKNFYPQIDYLLMIPDSLVYIPQSVQFTLLESLRNKFPVVGLSASYVKAGALASFDCDYEDLGRQAGEVALLLLAGATPAGIPPAGPQKTNFYLNIRTARRLGVKLPPVIVGEAAGVFGD